MATSLLLADDSPTIAKILKMALQSEPYEITSVLTAEEALNALRSAPPFLFLVDLSLPGKNGYEFARLIKRDSKLRQVRVVLLASAFEPVDETEFQACGADGLVKKPFDPGELRQSLRKIAERPTAASEGSRVTGSLSGFLVTGADEAPAPAQPSEDTFSSLLSGGASGGADADAILASLISGNEAPAAPPEPVAPSAPAAPSASLTLQPELADGVLDISSAFGNESGNTATIDFAAVAADELPPAAPPSAADAPLSANAQALAAFFEAEIQSRPDNPPSAPPQAAKSAPVDDLDVPPPADSFDASIGSIEWNAAADSSLNGWSSNQPAKKDSEPPPFQKPAASKTTSGFSPAPASSRSHSDTGGNLMFDTGGSSFRFSDDYIHRITKAFTGAPEETIPEAHRKEETPFFPQRSDDRPAAPSGIGASGGTDTHGSFREGGGAWSEHDVQKIESIVREEVQMVVREVAEKIAWEVIPELAENLIRKELEKVLKEMGQT